MLKNLLHKFTEWRINKWQDKIEKIKAEEMGCSDWRYGQALIEGGYDLRPDVKAKIIAANTIEVFGASDG